MATITTKVTPELKSSSTVQGTAASSGGTTQQPPPLQQKSQQEQQQSEQLPQQQQQQPQQPITYVVVPQQITATERVGQRQNERVWSTGICGCFQDCCGCLYAYCCYPCFVCTVANQMGEFCCGPWCCNIPIAPNPFLVGMRSKLRGQYGIKGSVCNDTVCVMCCQCCVAMQMSRELKHYQRV